MASRAVAVTELAGDPRTAWSVVKKEKPRASPGQVVVRMTTRALNPTDYLTPKLFLGHLQGQEVTIGSEGVGFVEEVGEGVTKVKTGQRVVPSFLNKFFFQGQGSWQDYVEVSENEIYFVPDSVSDDVAAQAIINPWTLYGLVTDQAVPKGEYLLQNAAGSVLGRQVIQLAKHWGIKTINIVRQDDVMKELKSLGADEVINSPQEDIVTRVKEITGGKGAYGALDPVAGPGTKAIVSCVRDGGKVFVYGAMGAPDNDVTIGTFDLGRVHVQWWGLLDFVKTDEKKREVSSAVGKLFEDKVLCPLTGKKFPLEDFKAALLEGDKAGRGGKVLLYS